VETPILPAGFDAVENDQQLKERESLGWLLKSKNFKKIDSF
jgi:hypothetical protein